MSIQINELNQSGLLLELDSATSDRVFGGGYSKLGKVQRLAPLANVLGDQVNIAQQNGLVNIAIQTNITTIVNLNLGGFKP